MALITLISVQLENGKGRLFRFANEGAAPQPTIIANLIFEDA
ncbi:MAG: hypothetical protein WCA35_14395 [Kovacikia sp.]